jgi:hypothetical protein
MMRDIGTRTTRFGTARVYFDGRFAEVHVPGMAPGRAPGSCLAFAVRSAIKNLR